jgi:HD-like signal output (HDOD) protein
MHQPDQDIRNRLLIARLPAMPQILIKLLAHLQADDLGMPELAALVAKDAGMTGKILTVANSSAYHRNGASVNLEQSLVSLGTDMIKTLVISDSVFQTFNSFPNSGSTDLRAFWKQSLTAAVLARDLARHLTIRSLKKPTWPACCTTSAAWRCWPPRRRNTPSTSPRATTKTCARSSSAPCRSPTPKPAPG